MRGRGYRWAWPRGARPHLPDAGAVLDLQVLDAQSVVVLGEGAGPVSWGRGQIPPAKHTHERFMPFPEQ